MLHFKNKCVCVCVPEFNMEVEKDCTSTSNLVCRCREGYVCLTDPHTRLCDSCVPVSTTIPSSTSPDVPSSTTSTTSSTKIKLGKHCCFLLHDVCILRVVCLKHGWIMDWANVLTGASKASGPMTRAGFLHRCSRHVPMLTHPKGPNYDKEK